MMVIRAKIETHHGQATMLTFSDHFSRNQMASYLRKVILADNEQVIEGSDDRFDCPYVLYVTRDNRAI